LTPVDYQRDDAAGFIYVDVMYPGKRNIEVYYEAGYTTIPGRHKNRLHEAGSPKFITKGAADGF